MAVRRAVVLALAVATLGIAGLPSASAVSDVYGTTKVHPFTMPGDQGCIRWSDPLEGVTYNCDPVNLIFPGRTWLQVRDLLRSKGWTTWGFGSNQWLHFDTSTRVVQNVQLFLGGFSSRYHMRVWGAPGGVTFAAVHHERGTFEHTIDMAWDGAEAFVAGQLCSSACTKVDLLEQRRMQDGVDGIANGTPTWRGWANDGAATVIR